MIMRISSLLGTIQSLTNIEMWYPLTMYSNSQLVLVIVELLSAPLKMAPLKGERIFPSSIGSSPYKCILFLGGTLIEVITIQTFLHNGHFFLQASDIINMAACSYIIGKLVFGVLGYCAIIAGRFKARPTMP